MDHLVNHPTVALTALCVEHPAASPFVFFNVEERTRKELFQGWHSRQNGRAQPSSAEWQPLFHSQRCAIEQ